MQVASHNVESVQRAVAAMAAQHVGRDAGVFFGQLLGMSDYIAFSLGPRGYAVYKCGRGLRWGGRSPLIYGIPVPGFSSFVRRYVPYGPVHECVAYLIRRIEV